MKNKQKSVLFGSKPDWEVDMRFALRGEPMELSFGNFHELDLEAFDAVVPLLLEDYGPLRALGLRAGGRALFPSESAVRICDDKLELNSLLTQLKRQLVPEMYDSWPPGLPFIVKKRNDEYGRNSFIVRTKTDLAKISHLRGEIDYFAQEFVPGRREFAAHILLRERDVKYCSTVVYEMDHDFCVRGESFSPQSWQLTRGCEHILLFREILSRLDFYDGICCFNYKISGSDVKILEINPRFGGSLRWDARNYVAAYLAALRGDCL